MKYSIFLISALLLFSRCRECDSQKRMGESVVIPTQFVSFSLLEMQNMVVYRVDNANPSDIDTLKLNDVITSYVIKTTQVQITDRAPVDKASKYGVYDSYLNNADLIFDWGTGRDTLADFVIKKSKVETSNKCHKDDPNVSVDQLTFTHKGQTVKKNELVIIYKK